MRKATKDAATTALAADQVEPDRNRSIGCLTSVANARAKRIVAPAAGRGADEFVERNPTAARHFALPSNEWATPRWISPEKSVTPTPADPRIPFVATDNGTPVRGLLKARTAARAASLVRVVHPISTPAPMPGASCGSLE